MEILLGDKITVEDLEYTVWLIEEDTVHLIDETGRGICMLKTEYEIYVNTI
jgi:hypothetical protein